MIENDIKLQLIAEGVDVDTNIAIGGMPVSPDNVILIAPAEGTLTAVENSAFANKSVTITKQTFCMNDLPDRRHSIAITVRNTVYSNAHDKIWKTYEKLVTMGNGYKVCNSKQMYFVALQTPYFLKEENGKFYFIFNLNVNAPKEVFS
jgi:hypothetical protein